MFSQVGFISNLADGTKTAQPVWKLLCFIAFILKQFANSDIFYTFFLSAY